VDDAVEACAANVQCAVASYDGKTMEFYSIPYQQMLDSCAVDATGGTSWLVKNLSGEADTNAAPVPQDEDIALYYQTQSKLLGKNGVALNPSTGEIEAANLCPYLADACSFSGCNVSCGAGVRQMMRQPINLSSSCDIANFFSQTTCESASGPCPQECPIACNGQQCGGPDHGSCNTITGKCTCEAGFSGQDCWLGCPVDAYGKICGGRGSCKADETQGGLMVCECNDGFTGKSCELPNVAYIGHSCFQDGQVLTAFYGESGNSMPGTRCHSANQAGDANKCNICVDSASVSQAGTIWATMHEMIPVTGKTCAEMGYVNRVSGHSPKLPDPAGIPPPGGAPPDFEYRAMGLGDWVAGSAMAAGDQGFFCWWCGGKMWGYQPPGGCNNY